MLRDCYLEPVSRYTIQSRFLAKLDLLSIDCQWSDGTDSDQSGLEAPSSNNADKLV